MIAESSIDEIAGCLGISRETAAKTVGELDFTKACTKWVLKQLTDVHKQARL